MGWVWTTLNSWSPWWSRITICTSRGVKMIQIISSWESQVESCWVFPPVIEWKWTSRKFPSLERSRIGPFVQLESVLNLFENLTWNIWRLVRSHTKETFYPSNDSKGPFELGRRVDYWSDPGWPQDHELISRKLLNRMLSNIIETYPV